MKATITTCRDPFNPSRRESARVTRRRRIRALAPRTQMPVIAYHNGRVILRAEWRRRVADGDAITFVVLPLGGGDGGKNPLQLVLSVAMMAVSGPIAAELLGPELAGMKLIGDLTLKTVVGGAISMAGNALISSAFAGRPSSPSPLAAASMAAPSPTYTIGAQGNMARLEAPIPVQYGRMMAYPDLAAQPYAEFAGNEQYVYQLMCLGQGYYEIESIRIEDTDIGSFPEIDYEVIEPGGTLTLFPANVTTSGEVAGQTAEYSTWLGPYVANAAGSTANTLAVDVVCPRGLYYANDSGGLDARSVTFTVEARTIDSGGSPTGSYVTLGTETVTGATSTPQRYSFRYTGLSGRYEVRLQRTSAAGGSSRYADVIAWAGLRAYLPETRSWAGQTLIAIRMRASNSLSGQATRKINVIATRKLAVWNGSAWTSPQVTRSPAWALADALRASYGGNLDDARIDTDQLLALATTCATRGDTFDARFDGTMTLWEALRKIGAAVRTRPYMQGGIVHVVRDEAQTVPAAMFSMRNIIRGSFSVDYLMPTDETADCIDVAYFDADVWTTRRVTAALPASSSLVPLKVDLFGVTGREQAYREGMYLAAVNRYRRKQVRFATEMEGYIPAYGDLITISHDMPAWGISGEVTAVEEVTGNPAIALWSPGTGLTKAADIVGPDGVTASVECTDDNVLAYELLAASPVVAVAGVSYSRTIFVKKDSVTPRYPLIALAFYRAAGGGSPNYAEVGIMTTDGDNHAFGGADVVGVVSAWNDDWWRVDLTGICGAGNDRMQLQYFPAGGTVKWSPSVTTTGTSTVWAGDVTRLTLSEPVTFASGDHYIGLRTRGGGVSGPYLCTAGRTAYEVVIAGLLDMTPYTGGAEERTHFAFGQGETWRQPARVTAIRPRGLYQVEIEATNEDASVHTADEGITAPAAQYSNLLNLYTLPQVSGLTVRSALDDATTALVSWQAAPGARSYIVDISSDGDTWTRAAETTGNNAVITAAYGQSTLIRVAALGFTLGPFVQVAYAAGSDYFWSGTDSDLFWSGTDSDPFWSA